MKPETFIRWAKEYYGNYRSMVEKEVMRELSRDWTQEEIVALREEALREISTQFKTPPDIHFIVNSNVALSRVFRINNQKVLGRQRERQRMIENKRADISPGDEVADFFANLSKDMKEKMK